MNILAELRQRFAAALSQLTSDPAPLLAMIQPAQDPRFGDYQANCAMPLGKQLGRPPREVAQQIVDAAALGDLCDKVEIAGPGFINLTLRDDWLAAQLAQAVTDDRLSIAPVAAPKTYVVDYSSPNIAKTMHVGHIRSTVIGDALYRTLKFLGHRAIGDNHIGDWGTQFGMIIYGWRHFGDQAAYDRQPVAELNRIYKLVRKIMDFHEGTERQPRLIARAEELAREVERQQAATPAKTGNDKADKEGAKKHAKQLEKSTRQLAELREEAAELSDKLASLAADAEFLQLARDHAGIGQAVLAETAKLHAGDEENLRLWREFLPTCKQDIQRIYDRLGVRFDFEHGESFYHPLLGTVVDDLQQRGLARESEGALCVFLDGFDAPMIVRKRDGAYLYATTDLATIKHRLDEWCPDAILYVVDFRQGDHFEKLFAAARLWGYADVDLRHVSFGTVLGDDGRPYKTRSGETVGLEGLLDEAVRRALAVVSTHDDNHPKGPQLSSERRQEVAEKVGIAAIKYADLSQNRTSDYVFSYDKMLALDGNTAAYMQYAYARVQSIAARGEIDIVALRASGAPIRITNESERALGKEILKLAAVLDEVLEDFRPNLLTTYLFDLSKRFSFFYEQSPVLAEEDPQVRTSRLLLCDLTARTIRLGLELLGIEVVERM